MFFKIRKIFILLLIIGIIFPFFSSAAISVGKPGVVAGPDNGLPAGAGIKDIEGIVTILIKVLKWIYTILFIVAIIFILFAAYVYLTAHDNPEKISAAHKQIMWAAVAIAVALISVSANVIINNFIGVESSGRGGTGSSSANPPSAQPIVSYPVQIK